jgi:hypothetical protein
MSVDLAACGRPARPGRATLIPPLLRSRLPRLNTLFLMSFMVPIFMSRGERSS